jgi:ribosomal protein S12 methylthiotransferase
VVRARVTNADEYDLWAEVIEEAQPVKFLDFYGA